MAGSATAVGPALSAGGFGVMTGVVSTGGTSSTFGVAAGAAFGTGSGGGARSILPCN